MYINEVSAGCPQTKDYGVYENANFSYEAVRSVYRDPPKRYDRPKHNDDECG